MESKDDKNSNTGKVAAATAGVEKLSLSKKKKTKFVKLDPVEVLKFVIDDGRGRDTDSRNINKPSHAKTQESRKSANQHQEKGTGRHIPATGERGRGRNMSRGSSNHTTGSVNYKADFEVNEDSQQHNKKQKRDGTKGNPLANNQQENDKEFKNNLMWDGETANSKKSRNQWKNLEVNNTTNKSRERIMNKPNSEEMLNENGQVGSRTTTAPIIDSSLYQNTYDSKTRNFVDGKQMFNNTSGLTEAVNEHSNRDDKLFTTDSLYAPTSYTSNSGPTYASMTTATGNTNTAGVYSTNSYIAATTHGYTMSNTIANTQVSQQQSSSTVYNTINSYSSFPQQNTSGNMNSYGQESSTLSTSNSTGYSAQNLYQQPSSVSYSSNSYMYPHTTIASSSNLSSVTQKYPPYGDIKNHLEGKVSSIDTKSSVEHTAPYVDYPNYMGTQYQDSLLKDVKTSAESIGHFEFRNTLDIAPIIPMDSYMTNYMPGPPPQSTADYKMLYWNNVHMPNILHAPPPQPPHSTMYKYTSHIPYEMPTSQAGQKPFMKLNDSSANTDNTYMSPTHMRVHQIPTHRYPMDNASSNKMPLYNDPQPNLSPLNEYQRYQTERHHFNDFGTFQTPTLTSSVQQTYQADTFSNTDLPNRILQPPVSAHHPYLSNTDDSLTQRYGADTRNKRAITGGAQVPHINTRSPHYPRHGYDDKDIMKPPVPHTSGNIFVNHNKYETPYHPTPVSIEKATTDTCTPVAAVTSTHVTNTSATIDKKPAECKEKPSSENNKKEDNLGANEKKNIKHQHQSPVKANAIQHGNERERDRGPRYGNERQRDNRPQQYQNNYDNHSNMIKTIDFHQFQNNIMKNHPGHNKNFRPYNNNKPYGDKTKEFKVTKIMQRPVEENKDEIAKLPIPHGSEKTEDKNNDKKVEDDNKLKEKNAKAPNNGASKKANKQQNIQILSPAKKATKEEENKKEKDELKCENKSKSTEDKENKSEETKPSDSKTNKKEDNMKENRQQQPPHRRRFNMNYYNLKYPRYPYENNVDFHYVPTYDGNLNKFNKFNGGNRYPNPRYNYDYDIDPRMYLYQGGGPYPPYGAPEPPMYNSLYNSNNYSNHKNRQKKADSSHEQPKPSKKQNQGATEEKKSKAAQNEEESKKSKKIKFKGTEILNENPLATSASSSDPTTPSTPTDNSNNPSSILKKSKSNEDCKVKSVQDLDEREPSSIQVSKTS